METTSTTLDQTSGCSACACGNESACPDYVGANLYILLSVVLISLITTSVLAAKSKVKMPANYKKLRMASIALAIIFVCISLFVVYKKVGGGVELSRTQQEYEKCIESNPQASCEY